MAKEKYAVGEFERRFLLDELPADATNARRIVDLYIENTRLRLRSVDRDGTPGSWKLGQKRRLAENDPSAIMHTTMYLEEAEAAVIAQLPGRRLVKTRWAIDIEGKRCSVDVFEESLDGLIMLEVDLGDPSLLAAFVPPSWIGPEVTQNEALTGGQLAGASMAELAPRMPV